MAQWLYTGAERCFIISGNRNRFRGFVFLFILFSIYIFIFSESGLLERMKLRGEFESLKLRIAGLEQENKGLETELDKYSSGEFSDRDIVSSGYVTNGGKIIRFTGEENSPSPEKHTELNNRFELDLNHLRIIWILFSIVVAVYYFKKRHSGVDEYHG